MFTKSLQAKIYRDTTIKLIVIHLSNIIFYRNVYNRIKNTDVFRFSDIRFQVFQYVLLTYEMHFSVL